MEHKPLFGDLIDAHNGLEEEIKSVDVAADLTLLLHHAGQSRADLARKLGWSRARVTQILSGESNLTVQTISIVTKALGYTFDVAFRKFSETHKIQPWVVQTSLSIDMQREPDIKSWMSRKTMTPMSHQFFGGHEFKSIEMTYNASNQPFDLEEIACAA